MGFTATGLWPHDQIIVRDLIQKIISTLTGAKERLKLWDAYSQKWFGDSSGKWIKELKTKLYRMASMVNLQCINIGGVDYRKRDIDTFAYAEMPRDGWQDLTARKSFVRESSGQNYQIRLDSAWNSAPIYKMPILLIANFKSLYMRHPIFLLAQKIQSTGSIIVSRSQ